MLAGEFCVVNGEISDLRCLMNALWPACLAQVPLPFSFPPNPLPQPLSIPAMHAG